MKEKAQRLKSYVMVGIPSLILIYFLGMPIYWVAIMNSMKDDPTGAYNEDFNELLFKAPVWVAERFRPYFAYWRMVDRQFGPGMVPTWDELQEMRD